MEKILLSVPLWFWLFSSGVFFGLGEFFSKKWASGFGWEMLVWALVVYTIGTLTWFPILLHKNNLFAMGIAWLLIGVAMTTLISLMVFREPITVLQMIGGVLALGAILLLSV